MARIEALFEKHMPLILASGGGGLSTSFGIRPVTDMERAQWEELHAQGKSFTDIARECTRAERTVRRHLQSVGRRSRKAHIAERRRTIARRILAAGLGTREIAKATRLSPSQAWAVRKEVEGQ